MKKTTYQFTNKLLSFFALMSFAISWLTPLFTNNVLAMSPKFTPKNQNKKTPTKEEIAKSMSNLPIQFEENRGQFDEKVKFSSKQGNHTVFLTTTEAVFTQKISEKKNYALKMELVNANKDAKSYGSEEKVSKTNYFRGNDSSKWQTDVSTFGRVNYQEVYQGIDLTWYGNADNDLEYDFIVKPNADYQQIELKFKGAKSLQIADNGDLLINTKYGTTTQRKPYTYQLVEGEKREIESQYELVGKKKVKFVVGEYDKSKDLVIDPILQKYGNYVGGSGQDYPYDMAVDSQGNIYVTGYTPSSDFPTTVGAFDTTLNGNLNDVFVSKISSNGSLSFSTYIGGNSYYGERGTSIAVDSNGNVFVAGYTYSSDFPVTAGAFDIVNVDSDQSGFITKINPTGTALIYSTYLGGSSSDEVSDITIDSNNRVRAIGRTNSSNFPMTGTPTVGGSFYTVIDVNGNSLFYSSLYGWNNEMKKIVLDSAGNSLILGTTSSPTFPVTVNAYDTTHNGYDDIFLMKVSSNGNLSYATYLGGSSYEGINNGMDITLDNSGNVYLLVAVGSSNFPRTAGALTRPLSGYDNFLVKFSPQLNTLLISTPLGPNQNIFGSSISVNSKGDIYVWGESNSSSYGTFGDNCTYNFFIAKYANDGTTIKNLHCFYNSGYGSTNNAIIDSEDNAYVLAATYNNLPTTPNAFDRVLNSDDAWVGKVKFVSQSIPYDFDADGKSDMAVYRNGTWHVNQSLWNYKAQPFGLATDTPVPADYDGDGKTDFAVWRPSDVSGQPDFYVLKSSTNTLQGVSWGTTTDVPVPADYDGDGRVDFAVYRTSSGEGDFFILNQTGTSRHYRFGVNGDKPVVNDYDGDGKADFAVFRPTTQTWYIANSTDNSVQYISWGLGTDKLVPADYDGDGKTDVAVFRESEGMWYINQSSNGQMKYQQWGLSTDKLVPADYDGDGKTDMAVYRDGQWFIWQSSNNSPNYANVFGNATDLPVQTLAVK